MRVQQRPLLWRYATMLVAAVNPACWGNWLVAHAQLPPPPPPPPQQQVAKLTAADAAAGAEFGISVAISGDTAVVGASYDGDARLLSGSAYVFVRTAGGSAWTQQQKLTAADAAAYDHFGISVAISGDTTVVGAYYDDDAGSNSGSAYVFVRTAGGSAWTQQHKLTTVDAAAGDSFGGSVAISGDTAVVGAAARDVEWPSHSGSAYVFVRTAGGSAWTQQHKLMAADAAANDHFGISVAISGDTAVVGAYQDGDAGSNSGSAYVFVRTAGGSAWTQQHKLTAADAAAGDYFGISVAISGDTAVVSSSGGSYMVCPPCGSAYVFVRMAGTSTWTQQQKLTASDAAGGDVFGTSVAISGDTAMVGAYQDGLLPFPANNGSAYVFVRTAGGSAWTQQHKLTAVDAAGGDRFGGSVAISGDTAVVGAFYDSDAGSNRGSAYIYALPPTPACSDRIMNGDETGTDCGGSCLACSSCSDGTQNGDETGTDCGGSCPACSAAPSSPPPPPGTAQLCSINSLFTRLTAIKSDADCRAGCQGSRCPPDWYPSSGDACNADCGAVFEPFWDECGTMLVATGMGGMSEMAVFYDSCLRALYPPGSCGTFCNDHTYACYLSEVHASCCDEDGTNCPAGQDVPLTCPVGCALVFPEFLETCRAHVTATYSLDMHDFETFEQTCLTQDGVQLVEYAMSLIAAGCTLDFSTPPSNGGHRRLQGHSDGFLQNYIGSSSPGCRWDDIDDMAQHIDTICGSLSITCSAQCAIATRQFTTICGSTLAVIMPAGDSRMATISAFEARCTSQADPTQFLHAMMAANCPTNATNMTGSRGS
jgi:hypothetical protein